MRARAQVLTLEPMSVEMAVEAMEAVGHDFYVFREAASDSMQVRGARAVTLPALLAVHEVCGRTKIHTAVSRRRWCTSASLATTACWCLRRREGPGTHATQAASHNPTVGSKDGWVLAAAAAGLPTAVQVPWWRLRACVGNRRRHCRWVHIRGQMLWHHWLMWHRAVAAGRGWQ